MTEVQERKLARLKNYRTRYEVAMVNGTDRRLVVYMSDRSFTRLLSAVREKLEAVKVVAGADVWAENRKLSAGDWRIEFTGRTQREAILNGELPFIGKVVVAEYKDEPKVRCACFIPGGIQCIRPMYHDGEHVYEPYAAFSTHI